MCLKIFKSSIGRKAVVAVTGLLLSGFVLAHLLGNLQIFLGQEALNSYAEHLQTLPLLLWPARIFLVTVLILHVFFSLQLAVENRRARPVPYAKDETVQAGLPSRTMVISGFMILSFIIYHLLHFTFGVMHPEFFHLLDAKGRHDVYSMMILSFEDPRISGAYVVAMAFLAAHLSHGFGSFAQSLGWVDEKGGERCKRAGIWLAWFIFIGYASIPAASFLGVLKPMIPGGV
jgi:succinate dehydrogenase / fumarate reductase cytochrome b subunit